MSSDSTTTGAIILSIYTAIQWKSALITKALHLNAYDILKGIEEAPS